MNRDLPDSSEVCDLGLIADYGELEFESISKGYESQDMDEKWDIVYQEPWLHFHRSWTGRGIFGLRFQHVDQRAVVVESWVRCGGENDTEDHLPFQRDLVRFLIDALLLRKRAILPRFPVDVVGIKRLAMIQVFIGQVPEPGDGRS